MRQLLLCVVLYVSPQIIYCQIASIEGRLFDSTNKESLVNAVISILNKDSTLVTFSRSNKNGDFKISKILPGEYVILITYPKYADYIEQIQLKPQEVFQFHTIYLTEKAKLLEEIIIRQSAIRIKTEVILLYIAGPPEVVQPVERFGWLYDYVLRKIPSAISWRRFI